ncbi:MAG: hypothetical protein WCK09_12575 [Bacteroidota bacterium]
MKLFEPFDELEIYSAGKTVLLKSRIPIPRCWIKISDMTGKILFKTNEKDLTDMTISLNAKGGFYHVTVVTKNRFATKMIFLE